MQSDMDESRCWPTRSVRYRAGVALVTLLMGFASAEREARAQTFWISEATDFTGNGCSSDDLNTVTASLRSELVNNSWTGDRVVNGDAWPQDFIESCNASLYKPGNDLADTRTLAVYAGHGFLEGRSSGVMFGSRRDGLCFVTFANTRNAEVGVARLGQMNNARNGFAAWITSCTMDSNKLADGVNYQWVNQNFGFDNSPAIESHQPKEWYRATRNKSNKNAWLEELEDKQGLFTGDNNPIVVSYSDTAAGCTDMHNNKRLQGNILPARTGGPACGGNPPAFVWCATMRSNSDGCS